MDNIIQINNLAKEINQDITARIKIINFKPDILSFDGSYSVYKFIGSSSANKLYDFTITFLSEFKLDIEEISDRDIELTLRDRNKHEEKFFCGRVYKISEDSIVANKHMYRIHVSSPIRYLTLNNRYEIYHEKSAHEIISDLFNRYSLLLNTKLEIKIDPSKSPIREYTTQYNQSDYDFINMLCEEEGYTLIYDFSSIEYNVILCELNEHVKIIPTKVLGSYNLSKKFYGSTYIESYYDENSPSNKISQSFGDSLNSSIKDNSNTSQLRVDIKKNIQKDRLESYNGSLNSDIKRNTKLDALREFCKSSKFKGSSTDLFLEDCLDVNITDTRSYKEAKAIIVSATYEGFFSNALNEHSSQSSDIQQYEVQYSAIPKDVIFIPEYNTEKPRINSILTAIVSKGDPDAASSANEIDVDIKGRIRVLFHFEENEATSCYLRLGTFFAGNGYGAQFLPRVNSEVIVSFVNGDPDKPIIIGALHNGENQNPYPLPTTKTKSFIKTHSMPAHDDQFGYNEIGFEDKNGSELLNLRAQEDFSLYAQDNSYKNIDNDQQEVIGNNEDTTIGGNQTEFVQMNKAETIAIAKALSIGAGYQTTVGGAKNETVGLSSSEQVGVIKNIVVGKRFELSVGASSLVLNSDGTIVLSGKNVSIEGSKAVIANGQVVSIN